MTECLEDDDVAALLYGSLPPEERAKILTHLDECARCRNHIVAVKGSERPAWQPPEEIDAYVLVEKIGHGGMGKVYKYHDRNLKVDRAIKFIRGDRFPPGLMRRLVKQEGQAMARVEDHNVAQVHGLDLIGEDLYLVMEYVVGKTLDKLDRPLKWPRHLTLGLGLAKGLAAIHNPKKGERVLHGDIKPQNVIVNGKDEVKLIDFGLALLVEPEQEGAEGLGLDGNQGRPGTFRGTPGYAAPEVDRREEYTARADVYSLGVVLYELCSGTLPRGPGEQGQTEYVPLARATRRVSRRFASIVDKCLHQGPEQRYASGEELCRALQKLADWPDKVRANLQRVAIFCLGLAVVVTPGYWWLKRLDALTTLARLLPKDGGPVALDAPKELLRIARWLPKPTAIGALDTMRRRALSAWPLFDPKCLNNEQACWDLKTAKLLPGNQQILLTYENDTTAKVDVVNKTITANASPVSPGPPTHPETVISLEVCKRTAPACVVVQKDTLAVYLPRSEVAPDWELKRRLSLKGLGENGLGNVPADQVDVLAVSADCQWVLAHVGSIYALWGDGDVRSMTLVYDEYPAVAAFSLPTGHDKPPLLFIGRRRDYLIWDLNVALPHRFQQQPARSPDEALREGTVPQVDEMLGGLAASRDGQRVLTGSMVSGTLCLWEGRKPLPCWTDDAEVDPTPSPEHVLNLGSMDGSEVDRKRVIWVAFAMGGPRFVSVREDGRIVVWRGPGNTVCAFDAPETLTAAFLPDGSILTGDASGLLSRWSVPDVERGRCSPQGIRDARSKEVTAIVSAPDGSFYTAGRNGDVVHWDGNLKELERKHVMPAVLSLALGGRHVLVGGQGSDGNATAELLDADMKPDKQLKQPPCSPDSPFWGKFLVALSPDGTTALTSGCDGTARLWDVNTGVQVTELVTRTPIRPPRGGFTVSIPDKDHALLLPQQPGFSAVWSYDLPNKDESLSDARRAFCRAMMHWPGLAADCSAASWLR